jgi:hypothetical protein
VVDALGHCPATTVKYLTAAKLLVPGAKEDRELTRMTRHFSGKSNELRAVRESKALTIAQVRLLVGDLPTVLRWRRASRGCRRAASATGAMSR